MLFLFDIDSFKCEQRFVVTKQREVTLRQLLIFIYENIPDTGAAIFVFHDLFCNQPPGGDQPHRRPTHGQQSSRS